MLKNIFRKLNKHFNLVCLSFTIIASIAALATISHKWKTNTLELNLVTIILWSIIAIFSIILFIHYFYTTIKINKMKNGKSYLHQNNKKQINWMLLFQRLLFVVLLSNIFYTFGAKDFSWWRLVACIFIFILAIIFLVIPPPKQSTKHNEKEAVDKYKQKLII